MTNERRWQSRAYLSCHSASSYYSHWNSLLESCVRPLLKLRLYVANPTFESTAAIAQVHSLLQKLGASYSLEVLEVQEHREQALEDGVPLTPLLLRLAPLPIQRIAVPAANVDELESALRHIAPEEPEAPSANDGQRQFELTLHA